MQSRLSDSHDGFLKFIAVHAYFSRVPRAEKQERELRPGEARQTAYCEIVLTDGLNFPPYIFGAESAEMVLVPV